MKVVLLVIAGVIILAIVVFVIYRTIAFQVEGTKFTAERRMKIQPLYEKLKRLQTLDNEDIFPYVQDVRTREMTYKFLKDNDLTDLFPKEFYTIVKAAESHLVNWLMFPTELGVCPDEIEYVKRVTIDFDFLFTYVFTQPDEIEKIKREALECEDKGEDIHYEVFKFRVNEPHWAAKNGWQLGVVGPYFDDSQPYEYCPSGTFSRGGSMDKTSPEEEVKWVHEMLLKRVR